MMQIVQRLTANKLVQELISSNMGRAALIGMVFLAALCVMNLAIHLLFGWSTMPPLRAWLRFANDQADSWKVMLEALAWIRANPDGALYEEIFFNRNIKFQYFPTSLLPLMGMQAIGIPTTLPVLNAINHILVSLTIVGVAYLTHRLLKQTAPNEPPRARLALTIFAGAATLLFYPIMMSFWLGQLQVWINALFVLACLLWMMDRRIGAGVAVGLICLLKPQFGLFALWGLIQRDWRFLAGLVTTGAVGCLISLAVFGLENHLDYLPVLQVLSRHGEAYQPNFSFNGLLHHVLGNAHGLQFDNFAFPPFHPIVYAGTLVTSIIIIAIGLWPSQRTPAVGSLAGFQRAAVAFTIASPIAWEHHYGVIAPILAVLLCHAFTASEDKARNRWLLAIGACYFFIANSLSFTKAFTGTPLNVLQSYTLFAGLGVLYMLWRIGRTPVAASAAGTR